MSYTLGIDIGTFESKGVIVDVTGTIIATATAPHEMIVPQPGWAEHRAEQDWWHDFCTISRQLLADRGIEPGRHQSRRHQRHRPVHAAGRCRWPSP